MAFSLNDLNYEKDSKERMPWEHYTQEFATADPKEIASRLSIPYDEEAKKLTLTFLGTQYQITWPDFEVTHTPDDKGFYPLENMIYARILEPRSKRSSYKAASEFLEKPSYKLHDVYRALDVLGAECDLIQAELYKNSHFLGARNDKVLYYDCSNYYFEIEQEDGNKKYGKSKEHRPNPIIQMGLFMDGDGIPLAFSTFAGNANEQTSLKPLEKKILGEFGCQKFIYCSDAGLGSESIREYNHMGERAYIVTQSIKKLKKEEEEIHVEIPKAEDIGTSLGDLFKGLKLD